MSEAQTADPIPEAPADEAALEEGNGWFKLFGDSRLGACATDGCGGQPTWRLEAGGVGSNYCSGCSARIRALSVSPLTEEQPAEGWKLVPVEPTEAMIASAVASYHLPPGDVAVATEHVAKVFRAMLAAAPLPRSTTGGAK